MYQIHMKSCERWKLHGEPWRELLLVANRWANHPRPLPLRRKCARAVQPFVSSDLGVWSRWYWNPEGCYGCYYVIQMSKVSSWTLKMFVVCLQTPWILPAWWQDGSMIASVCTIWMDVLLQLNICPNGIILFVDRKRHQLILKLSQDLHGFCHSHGCRILSISSRIDTHTLPWRGQSTYVYLTPQLPYHVWCVNRKWLHHWHIAQLGKFCLQNHL